MLYAPYADVLGACCNAPICEYCNLQHVLDERYGGLHVCVHVCPRVCVHGYSYVAQCIKQSASPAVGPI